MHQLRASLILTSYSSQRQVTCKEIRYLLFAFLFCKNSLLIFFTRYFIIYRRFNAILNFDFLYPILFLRCLTFRKKKIALFRKKPCKKFAINRIKRELGIICIEVMTHLKFSILVLLFFCLFIYAKWCCAFLSISSHFLSRVTLATLRPPYDRTKR